jgi:hypothetical protein
MVVNVGLAREVTAPIMLSANADLYLKGSRPEPARPGIAR